MAPEQVSAFRETVWDYFYVHARSMPWRDNPSPYRVLVSELMLQQTQVARVIPKFEAFMERFPSIPVLADASLADVLGVWSGLGYNRRAKFLHAAAQMVTDQFGGHIPDNHDNLIRLPGVGKNTAGAILAYAFNRPVLFIETNIRTVYFHHFFDDAIDIADTALLPLIEATLDREHPREWYWALMDYGTHLKQTVGNNIVRSKHYVRQAKFEGSRRQLRGWVLRTLIEGVKSPGQLRAMRPDTRLDSVVRDLIREGFVIEFEGQLRLTASPKLR